jgi:hypothetical protein
VKHVPFDIRPVSYVYDIPSGEYREAHVHQDLHPFLICLSGGLVGYLDEGRENRSVHPNRTWVGLNHLE